MVKIYICDMVNRQTSIATLLKEFPAVAIVGPRQVGKSTLAKELVKQSKKSFVYLDLEAPSDRRKLSDPETFFEQHRDSCVIIDEVQLMPEIFSVLRPEIDSLRKPGRFILTGSANPLLMTGSAETLAGRIAYYYLTPIGLQEALLCKLNVQKHWFRGGYPDALLAKNDEAFHRWMSNYIQTFVQRDLRLLFDVNLPPQTVYICWNMIANNNGSELNYEEYARAMGVTGPTVKKYIQFLETAFLVRLLPPWATNSKKRLVKAPKVYIRDSGIVHHFTGISNFKSLISNTVIGGSWEGYVVEQIIRVLPSNILPYYYRTHQGAEVDLVLVKNNTPIVAIEIKHSKAPTVSAGYYQVIADIKTMHNYVIYSGTDRYKTKEKITVLGLLDFLEKELKLLKRL